MLHSAGQVKIDVVGGPQVSSRLSIRSMRSWKGVRKRMDVPVTVLVDRGHFNV